MALQAATREDHVGLTDHAAHLATRAHTDRPDHPENQVNNVVNLLTFVGFFCLEDCFYPPFIYT